MQPLGTGVSTKLFLHEAALFVFNLPQASQMTVRVMIPRVQLAPLASKRPLSGEPSDCTVARLVVRA